MRVATCTPVEFDADEHFFGRDSGLLARGFGMTGHESLVVMPGTRRSGDAVDLVRAAPGDLEDVGWWLGLKLDLVILYAWGDPRFQAVATAIRSAGIRLVHNLDAPGMYSPYADRGLWWRCLSGLMAPAFPLRWRARMLMRGLRDWLPALFETRRLAMMATAEKIAVVSPAALDAIRGYAIALGHPEVAAKLIVVPHPVDPVIRPDGAEKISRVLVVGRWLEEDEVQKDPHAALAALHEFLLSRPAWSAVMIGRGAPRFQAVVDAFPADVSRRIDLRERVDRPALASYYSQSRILLCSSRFESFHITSGEALCCGCSVVAADHPLLATTGWFASKDSGTLAASRSPADLAAALAIEAAAWESGGRDPRNISSGWQALLHADQVASTLIERLGEP